MLILVYFYSILRLSSLELCQHLFFVLRVEYSLLNLEVRVEN